MELSQRAINLLFTSILNNKNERTYVRRVASLVVSREEESGKETMRDVATIADPFGVQRPARQSSNAKRPWLV